MPMLFATSIKNAIMRSEWLTSPLSTLLFASILLSLIEYFFTIRYPVNPAIIYILYWVILTGALVIVAGVSLQRLHREEDRLLVSTFVVGFILGLMMAVIKLMMHQELWTLFNLFAEPLRTALYGLVIAWLFAMRARSVPLRRLSST